MIPGPAVSILHENLLEMQMIKLHSRPTESEPLFKHTLPVILICDKVWNSLVLGHTKVRKMCPGMVMFCHHNSKRCVKIVQCTTYSYLSFSSEHISWHWLDHSPQIAYWNVMPPAFPWGHLPPAAMYYTKALGGLRVPVYVVDLPLLDNHDVLCGL